MVPCGGVYALMLCGVSEKLRAHLQITVMERIHRESGNYLFEVELMKILTVYVGLFMDSGKIV